MKKLTLLLTAFLFSLSANATLITVELNNTDYNVGDAFSADIVISDIELDPTFQRIVGDFEFNLNFDNTIIEFVSASFGDKLDVDPDPFWASDQSILSSLGSVLLSEISYALDSDLFFAQDGLTSFVLASIDFNVIGTGMSTVGLSNVAIGDAYGNEFLAVSTMGKEYTVANGNPVGVPEPSTVFLMLIAMGVFVIRQKGVKSSH
jgi:hypothetical protein